MVSMQDIADRLNVSRSTVSLVLSGKAGSKVSPAVQKEVIRVAKELRYHVNDLARSLRTGESKIISVIVTDISNDFFGRLTFHIQEEAKKAGYLVLTVNSNEDASDFRETIGMLMSKKVDGIIVVPPPGGENSISEIIERGVPVVTVDRESAGLKVDYVGVDNYGASFQAVKGLIDDGFRNIAVATLDLDISPLNARIGAYEDAMREAGLEDMIMEQRIRFLHEDAEIESMIRRFKDCDAVYFTSQRVFIRAMSFATHSGLAFRKDMCLLCFDDISPYKSLDFDVRYVEQPVGEIARKAFDLLIKKVKGEESAAGRYLFQARCVV